MCCPQNCEIVSAVSINKGTAFLWLNFLKIHCSLHPDNTFETATDHRFADQGVSVDTDGQNNVVAGNQKLIHLFPGVLVSDAAPIDNGAKDLIIV